MKMLSTLVLAVLALSMQGSQSLICKPCSETKCVPVSSWDCYQGAELIKDYCGCCDVCSKGYGEPCEGVEAMGKCSQALGLACEPPRCKNPDDIKCTSQHGICTCKH